MASSFLPLPAHPASGPKSPSSQRNTTAGIRSSHTHPTLIPQIIRSAGSDHPMRYPHVRRLLYYRQNDKSVQIHHHAFPSPPAISPTPPPPPASACSPPSFPCPFFCLSNSSFVNSMIYFAPLSVHWLQLSFSESEKEEVHTLLQLAQCPYRPSLVRSTPALFRGSVVSLLFGG